MRRRRGRSPPVPRAAFTSSLSDSPTVLLSDSPSSASSMRSWFSASYSSSVLARGSRRWRSARPCQRPLERRPGCPAWNSSGGSPECTRRPSTSLNSTVKATPPSLARPSRRPRCPAAGSACRRARPARPRPRRRCRSTARVVERLPGDDAQRHDDRDDDRQQPTDAVRRDGCGAGASPSVRGVSSTGAPPAGPAGRASGPAAGRAARRRRAQRGTAPSDEDVASISHGDAHVVTASARRSAEGRVESECARPAPRASRPGSGGRAARRQPARTRRCRASG